MVDFAPYNAGTHPNVKVNDDYNNLLDHGLEKTASFIIRKNGVYYEAIQGGGASGAGTIVYGGAGNAGSTNGTSAAAVINAALAVATGRVYLQAATYTITVPIVFSTNNCSLEGPHFGGYSTGCANLVLSANCNLISQIGTNVTHKDGLTLRNLRLSGTGYSGDAIHLEYASNFIIENVSASTFTGAALYCKECWVGNITMFQHDNCGSVAGSLAAVHLISAEDATSDLTFNKLVGSDWAYKGLIVGTVAAANVNVNHFFGIEYEGDITGTDAAVSVEGALNSFSGGGIAYITATNDLVVITGDMNTFTGVTFYNTLAQDPAVIHIVGDGNRSVVVGCGFAYASIDNDSLMSTVANNGGITVTSSNVIKKLFVPVTYTDGTMGVKGDFAGAVLTDGIDLNAYASFSVPVDFQSFESVKVVLISSGTGNLHHIVYSTYGASTENYNTHSATAGDFVTALTTSKITLFDLYGGTLLEHVAAGDYVGLKYTRWGSDVLDTVGADVLAAGFIFSYYG
jgi:hypothetical protein